MATSVTVDDLARWLAMTAVPATVSEMLDDCLAAASSAIGERLGTWTPDPWPGDVDQAVLMLSARLFKRRNSPEGFSGFGDLGVVRVTSLDPDVETQLGPWLAFHFA